MNDGGTVTAPNGARVLHAQRPVSFVSASAGAVIKEMEPPGRVYVEIETTTDLDERVVKRLVDLRANRHLPSYKHLYLMSFLAGTNVTVLGEQLIRRATFERLERLRHDASDRHAGMPTSGPNPPDDRTRTILEAMIRAQFPTRSAESEPDE